MAIPLGAASVVGVGVDAVDVARLRRTLERTPTFADRAFTDGERALAASRKDPVPALAARFAAKEAVVKALSPAEGIGPSQIEIEAGEPPTVRLRGRAASAAADAGVEVRVSLTHSREIAAAVAVADPR